MRWAHRLWAFLRGYFWIPCPVCGRDFGGHEASGAALWKSPGCGRVVCRDQDCITVALNSWRAGEGIRFEGDSE